VQRKQTVRPPQPLTVYRTARGWTTAELADAAGVSRRTIAGLEAGDRRPHPATQQALARALCVDDVGELFPVNELRGAG